MSGPTITLTIPQATWDALVDAHRTAARQPWFGGVSATEQALFEAARDVLVHAAPGDAVARALDADLDVLADRPAARLSPHGAAPCIQLVRHADMWQVSVGGEISGFAPGAVAGSGQSGTAAIRAAAAKAREAAREAHEP